VIEVPKEIPPEPVIKEHHTVDIHSPEPWGNPDSPLPEENPDYQEDYLDHPEPM